MSISDIKDRFLRRFKPVQDKAGELTKRLEQDPESDASIEEIRKGFLTDRAAFRRLIESFKSFTDSLPDEVEAAVKEELQEEQEKREAAEKMLKEIESKLAKLDSISERIGKLEERLQQITDDSSKGDEFEEFKDAVEKSVGHLRTEISNIKARVRLKEQKDRAFLFISKQENVPEFIQECMDEAEDAELDAVEEERKRGDERVRDMEQLEDENEKLNEQLISFEEEIRSLKEELTKLRKDEESPEDAAS